MLSVMEEESIQKRLTPLEIERGLRRNLVAGSFASLFGVCVAGQFVTAFVLGLGGGPFEVGLLTTLPLMAYPFQILSALLTEQFRSRRAMWFWTALVHRAMWLAIALLPILMGNRWSGMALTVFLILFFITSAAGSAASPPWFSWMADLVPKDQVGRFWGQRRSVLNFIALSSAAAGWFVDWAKTPFAESPLLPYSLLFALGAVMGIVDLIVHYSVPEPPMTGESRALDLRAMMAQPLRDAQFRRFMVYLCSWNCVLNFANAFLNYLFLDELKLSQFWIAFFSCAMLISRIIMARYWGYLVDRFGASPINSICTVGLVFVPVGYIFVTPDNSLVLNLSIITAIWVYSGMFNIGIETTHTALMLGLSPSANKAMFVAVVNSLVGICAAISPMLGAAFLHWAFENPLHIGGWEIARFQELFLAAFVLRALVAPLSFRLGGIEQGSATLVVRRLFDANPFSVIHHTYVLSGSSAEAARMEAVRKLAAAGSRIATTELIKALRDPSLDVRIEAARALERIGDVAAVEPLIECLKSPESGIQQEAAAALGKLGHTRGLHALIESLGQPPLQSAVIRALGEIGDLLAIHPLLDLMEQPTTSAATRAIIAEALSRLTQNSPAAYDMLPRIFPIFRAAQSELLRQQLALDIGNLIGETGEFYDLLARERRLPGHGIARLIERLRDRDDIPQELLDRAQAHCVAENWAEAAQYFALLGLGREELLLVADYLPTSRQALPEFFVLESRIRAHNTASKHRATLWLLARMAISETADANASREEALLALYALSRLGNGKL